MKDNIKRYNLLLSRMSKDDKQTIGMLSLYDSKGDLIHTFDSLEPAEGSNNKKTRILAGTYTISKRTSNKFGNHYILEGVKDRTYILIHAGNTYHDTIGCILVGDGYGDINKDGYLDVLNSKKSLKKLLSYNITKMVIMDECVDESICLNCVCT